MPETERRLLINRKQDISVYMLPDGKHLQVEAEMQDEVHEMRIRMTLTYPSLRIKEVRFEIPGVPDPLCTEALRLADTLIGQHAVPGLRWGGENKNGNCLLLKDLFRAACTMMSYAQSCVSRVELNALFPGITEEQLFKIWTFMRPDMKNTCLRYADDSAFMQPVQETPWPNRLLKNYFGPPRNGRLWPQPCQTRQLEWSRGSFGIRFRSAGDVSRTFSAAC